MQINEMPLTIRASPEVIQKATDWLVSNKDKFTRTCNFAVFGGDERKEFLASVCHANMATSYIDNGLRDVITTDVAVERQIKEGYGDTDLYRPFLKWLVEGSVFSRFILTDLSLAMDGGIVITSDAPSPLVQNILIMSRYVREVPPEVFKLFNSLSEKYSPEAAFCFTFGTQAAYWNRAGGDVECPTFYLDSLCYAQSWHKAWGLFPNLSSLKNFLSGNFINMNPSPSYHYRNHATTMGGVSYCVTSMSGNFFENVALEYGSEYLDGLRSIRGEGNAKPVISNPFAKQSEPKRAPTDVTYRELIDYVLPFLQSKGIFDVNACSSSSSRVEIPSPVYA